MRESYKYCPNCAYRLRPELRAAAPRPRVRVPLGQRLVALGGYLGFASLLLLVALTGIRLFLEPEVEPSPPSVTYGVRDRAALPLERSKLVKVNAGDAFYGLYDAAEYDRPDGKVVEIYTLDDPFELATYEVTNDQYYAFLSARAQRTGEETDAYLYPESWSRLTGHELVTLIYPRDTGNYPVSGIHYQAAIEFCQWFWETELGADEDLVADLPTILEYIRAARHEKANYNFPWGERLDDIDDDVNPWPGYPRAVNDARIGAYDGFFGLVGNVAEWVHSGSETEIDDDRYLWHPSAAGFSFYDGRRLRESWDDSRRREDREEEEREEEERDEERPPGGERLTPFGPGGFPGFGYTDARQDIGFRVLVRHTPALPEFKHVERGPIRRRAPPPGLLRMARADESRVVEDGEIVFRTRHVPAEPAVVSFPGDAPAEVGKDFSLSRHEVTNRQYLAFVADEADRRLHGQVAALIPDLWLRPRPLEQNAVFVGPYGNAKITRLYPPGQENYPVQGLSIEQAEAYAAWLSRRLHAPCRLPTVSEYLRAARGDGAQPYPWGDDAAEPALICAERFTDPRPASLLGRSNESDTFTGLVGNLLEYVTDPIDDRILLAGGCYRFPARLCTLDTMVDADWGVIQLELDEGRARRYARALRTVGDGGRALGLFPDVFPLLAAKVENWDAYELQDFSGFRVVLDTEGRY